MNAASEFQLDAERTDLQLVTHVQPRTKSLMEKFGRGFRSLFGIDRSPQHSHFFSDAFGESEGWNPLGSRDLDVIISTDYSSRPTQPTHEKYDTLGHEQVTNHFLRLIFQQLDELSERKDLSRRTRKRARKMGTGVFINYAPRINHSNASPFWLATANGGDVRIVSTPLSALSAVRDRIETLQYLPNPTNGDPGNGLYDSTQQFRSKYTPILLNPDHGLDLVPADPSIIPPFRTDWHVSYVDRYGNMNTYSPNAEAQWEELNAIAEMTSGGRRQVHLMFGSSGPHAFTLGTTLGKSDPGEGIVYNNGEALDFARKWTPDDTAQSKMEDNAFTRTKRPRIGSTIGTFGEKAVARYAKSHCQEAVNC